MEDLLEQLADLEYFDLLDALKPQRRGETGLVDLKTLLTAARRQRLLELRQRIFVGVPDASPEDCPLEEVIRSFSGICNSKNGKLGLRHLLHLTVDPTGPRLAPGDARLGWLMIPKNIDQLIAHLRKSHKENSIKNSLWTGISKLLQYYVGEERARGILRQADRPHEKDAREISTTALELHRLINSMEFEMRMFTILAAFGIDKSPILKLRVRDFDRLTWKLS